MWKPNLMFEYTIKRMRLQPWVCVWGEGAVLVNFRTSHTSAHRLCFKLRILDYLMLTSLLGNQKTGYRSMRNCIFSSLLY